MTDERTAQADRTRQRLLTTAERLFALEGISAVSNRQISKDAGQGNNYAVGHHFGGKTGILQAILDAHDVELDALRAAAVANVGENAEFRDWAACLVGPQVEYIATVDQPSYFARFCAQFDNDSVATELLYASMARSQALLAVLDGFYKALPPLPQPVIEARDAMTRHLIMSSLADVERALEAAREAGEPGLHWTQHRDIIVDALVGLWLAPVTCAL